MGGTVAVTLRKPDGTEYRMDRWTNSMPWGIMNMKMLKHDMEHVDEYLKLWLEMQDDYERNKHTGVFENNMTDCYFPSDGLAPCGYGLVVVDMVNNVILDMQGYTSFDSMCAASVGMDIDRNPDDEDNNVNIFKEFYDAGQVTGMLQRSDFDTIKPGDPYPPIPDTLSFADILEELAKRSEIFDFKLDLKPFTYEKFEECDAMELIRYRARLLELGFEISHKENEVWAAQIDEAIEEYGEDDD